MDDTLPQNGSFVRFCLNSASVLAPFERKVIEALSQALLFEAEVKEFSTHLRPVPFDFAIRVSRREIFLMLYNDCDALMGLRYIEAPLPEWLTISTPYLSTKMVFLTADPQRPIWQKGASLGARLGAPSDATLVSYLGTLSEAQRPSRIPYPDDAVVLARLEDGTLAGALVWQTAAELQQIGPERWQDLPFATRPVEFGLGFLHHNSYLRDLLSEGLNALAEDGTLARLYREFIAEAGRLRG